MSMVLRLMSALIFIFGMPLGALIAAEYMIRETRGSDGAFPAEFCRNRFCYPAEWLLWLEQGAQWALLSAAGIVGTIVAASLICGTGRRRNALIFPVLIPLAKIATVAMMLVNGALVVALLYVGTRFFAGAYPHSLKVELFVAGSTLMAVGATLYTVFSIDADEPMNQLAMALTPESAPEVWEGVEAIAEALDAEPPDNVIVGLEPNFYACAAPIRLPGREGGILHGETLYLSASLMRLMTVEEVTAVVGHELGHFRGADCIYSKRFAPLHQGLWEAMCALEEERDSLIMEIVLVPALSLLRFIHDIFSLNQSAISRTREYVADRCGAEVASGTDIATSLAKMGLAMEAWGLVESGTAANLSRGVVGTNMAEDFERVVARGLGSKNREELAREAMATETSHPFDSHPSLAKRMKALKVKPDVLTHDALAAHGHAGRELVRGITRIEERLTEIRCVQMRDSGEADNWGWALQSGQVERDPGRLLSAVTAERARPTA